MQAVRRLRGQHRDPLLLVREGDPAPDREVVADLPFEQRLDRLPVELEVVDLELEALEELAEFLVPMGLGGADDAAVLVHEPGHGGDDAHRVVATEQQGRGHVVRSVPGRVSRRGQNAPECTRAATRYDRRRHACIGAAEEARPRHGAGRPRPADGGRRRRPDRPDAGRRHQAVRRERPAGPGAELLHVPLGPGPGRERPPPDDPGRPAARRRARPGDLHFRTAAQPAAPRGLVRRRAVADAALGAPGRRRTRGHPPVGQPRRAVRRRRGPAHRSRSGRRRVRDHGRRPGLVVRSAARTAGRARSGERGLAAQPDRPLPARAARGRRARTAAGRRPPHPDPARDLRPDGTAADAGRSRSLRA